MGEIFLEAVPLSLLPFDENLGGVSTSVGVDVESCLRYLLILLELGPPFSDPDREMDVPKAADADEYRLYDVVDGPLTLEGLTHSAWWESSLYMGIIFSQNSQGSITSVLPSAFSWPLT